MRANRSRLRRFSSLWSPTTLSFSWSERDTNGVRRRVSSSRVATRSPARSSSCFTFCASFSFISTFFSSFLLSSRAARVRKARAEASTASPDAPASTGRPGVGKLSPAERRTVRSLRCGPGSTRQPGRSPGGGVFCPRGAMCASCSTSSPTLAIFGPLGAVWCVISARVIATVIRSCRSHERSRRCRLRAAAVAVSTPELVDIIKAQKSHQHKTRATCLSLGWCVWYESLRARRVCPGACLDATN